MFYLLSYRSQFDLFEIIFSLFQTKKIHESEFILLNYLDEYAPVLRCDVMKLLSFGFMYYGERVENYKSTGPAVIIAITLCCTDDDVISPIRTTLRVVYDRSSSNKIKTRDIVAAIECG